MNSTHQTPLPFHLKQKKFWIDIFILIFLWTFSLLLPHFIDENEYSLVVKLIKIIPTMATIELIGFISLHLFGKKQGLLLQGFLGGFISSTMVFFKISNSKSTNNKPHHLSCALLLSTISMLILSVVIIFVLNGRDWILLSIPYLIQIFSLLVSIFFIIKNKEAHSVLTNNLDTDTPIMWRKVASFTIILSILIFSMRFLTDLIPESRVLTSFLVSLFESHAILAATLADDGIHQEGFTLQKIIFFIVLGNTMSKSFLVLRIKDPKIIRPVLVSLLSSLVLVMIYSGSLFYL